MKRAENDKTYAQALAAELRRSTPLTKSKDAIEGLNYAATALKKLAVHMASIEFGEEKFCEHCGRKGISPEAGGKTLAYLAKVVNEEFRMLEFAKGKPDQRTEVTGLADLMKLLTNDEFKTVSEIIDTASKRLEKVEGQA